MLGTDGALHLWIDRHTVRTGGRSTQQVMARLKLQQLLWHREALVLGGSTGYSHTAQQLRDLLKPDAANAAVSAKTSRPPHPGCAVRWCTVRVALQTSSPNFITDWLPLIRRVRGRESATVSVTLSVRVRDPLQHYLSAYIWATQGKAGKGLGKYHARAAKLLPGGNGSAAGVSTGLRATLHSTSSSGRVLGGQATHVSTPALGMEEHWRLQTPAPSFMEWSAAAANLQSQSFLFGGGDEYVTSEISGR